LGPAVYAIAEAANTVPARIVVVRKQAFILIPPTCFAPVAAAK
jgi:hypothetical protein